MALISCIKCGKLTSRGGFAIWQWIVAICFFPIGLLCLLAGREPTSCKSCGHIWNA